MSGLDHGSWFSKIEPDCMCRWPDLCSVICPRVILNVDDLVHLSHMPALTQLEFVPSDSFPASHPLLVFPNLHDLTLRCESSSLISRLLFRTRLLAITNFEVNILECPSKQELSSLLASVQASCAVLTIQSLRLICYPPLPRSVDGREARLLDLEYLRPCMAFSDLRCLTLDMEWNVDLSDSEVLALGLAWPKLEKLLINEHWGWNSEGGITPGGLLGLWETCRSLNEIAVSFDTRGYTQVYVYPSEALRNPELGPPPHLSIHVLDSAIEEESVDAIIEFFCNNATRWKSGLSLCVWDLQTRSTMEYWEYARWDDISRQVNSVFRIRSECGLG